MHIERHFRGADTVRDVVIGMSDGLTVPFALAAGVSGVVAESRIVLTAGLAEVVAGAIAMGLGGYLAARSQADHYASELLREKREVREMAEHEAREVEDIFSNYGVDSAHVAPLLEAFRAQPDAWVDFMMRFELGLEKPESGRALKSALAIALAYVTGGLIPLAPYMFYPSVRTALGISAAVTLVALLLFGWGKAHYTGARPLRGAIETAAVGAIAASAAFYLAHLLG